MSSIVCVITTRPQHGSRQDIQSKNNAKKIR